MITEWGESVICFAAPDPGLGPEYIPFSGVLILTAGPNFRSVIEYLQKFDPKVFEHFTLTIVEV